MFGISFTELAMILIVALVVVGPHKLPGMLRTLGEWVRKLRRLTTEVRAQTGIDDILRHEGIEGGLSELRGMLRGDLGGVAREHRPAALPAEDPYRDVIEFDASREYPPEGVDAHGALPDDLVDEAALPNAPAGDGRGGERGSSGETGEDDIEKNEPSAPPDAAGPSPTGSSA